MDPTLPAEPPTPVPVPLSGAISPLDGGTPGQRRAIAVAELVLCSSVPTQLLLQAALVGAGMPPRTAAGGFSLPFVVTMTLADTVLLILLMVVLTRAHGDSVSELWLGRRPVVKEALLGLALVPVDLPARRPAADRRAVVRAGAAQRRDQPAGRDGERRAGERAGVRRGGESLPAASAKSCSERSCCGGSSSISAAQASACSS